MLRRRRNDERGAAAVEFALVSLVLLTIIGVTFQFAIYLWAFQAASNGAREGAREWAVNPCGTGQTTAVTNAIEPAAKPGTINASAAFAKGAGNTGAGTEPGDTVTVTVTMQPRAVGFSLVPGWDYNNAVILKKATARVEGNAGCP